MDGLDAQAVNLSSKGAPNTSAGHSFDKHGAQGTVIPQHPTTTFAAPKHARAPLNVERRPHPMVSQIDALDTTAFRARMTAPDRSLTPTAFPPSTTIAWTCDFSSTLPPSFSMPFTYAKGGVSTIGTTP